MFCRPPVSVHGEAAAYAKIISALEGAGSFVDSNWIEMVGRTGPSQLA